MNSRQLSILGIIALVVLGIAVWLGSRDSSTSTSNATLYPALKGKLANVKELKIFKAGDVLVADLHRTDAGWAVKERNDYPADAAKINSLLLSLESAKIREEKTSNPDLYSSLGVQDISKPDATGQRLELVGTDPAVNLIVGKGDAMARTTYVRRSGEAQSWMVSEQFTVPTETASWLNKELLNIDSDRIHEVVVQIGNAPRYSVVKNARSDLNFDVTPIPKGRELNSVSAANTASQSLVALQLDDVRPASEFASEKPVAHTTLSTFDGVVLDVDGYQSGDKHWIVVTSHFDEALARRFAISPSPSSDTTDKSNPVNAAKVGPTKDKAEPDVQKLQAEVDAINKRLTGHAFAIAQYKYEALFKPIDDLLKKK